MIGPVHLRRAFFETTPETQRLRGPPRSVRSATANPWDRIRNPHLELKSRHPGLRLFRDEVLRPSLRWAYSIKRMCGYRWRSERSTSAEPSLKRRPQKAISNT